MNTLRPSPDDKPKWWQRLKLSQWTTTNLDREMGYPDTVAKPTQEKERRVFGVKVSWRWYQPVTGCRQ